MLFQLLHTYLHVFIITHIIEIIAVTPANDTNAFPTL